MEVVERRLVGQVVWVEGLVKVEVGLEVGQAIRLLRWLRGSAQGQTQQLGLRGSDGQGGVPSSRGGVAAAGRRSGCVQGVRLRCAAPDGLLGGVQVLRVGGPGLAAGGRLQSVRRGGGATKGAVAEGGDARAGAAREGGVTAIQDGRRTGGRGRYRLEGRLGGERTTPG